LIGVVVPFLFGTLTALLFQYPTQDAILIGIVLSATSVSISAQTLLEIGKLRTREGVRYVLFVPEGTEEFLRRDLNGPELVFEAYSEISFSQFRKHVFLFFLRFSLITRTGINLAWHGSAKRQWHGWSFFFAFPLFLVLHFTPYARDVFQYLEEKLYPDPLHDHFFEQYKPNLVVVTNILAQPDIAFIKSARRFGVESVGMTKGWDNLDKHNLQVKPDKLIVQNKKLLGYAMKYQRFAPEDVFIGGFPAFDIFFVRTQSLQIVEHRSNRGIDVRAITLTLPCRADWQSSMGHPTSAILSVVEGNNQAGANSFSLGSSSFCLGTHLSFWKVKMFLKADTNDL